MTDSRKRGTQSDGLRYCRNGASQGTVRRYYIRWRQEQIPPLPERCDNLDCCFYTNPLIWNGKKIKPILDHLNGNNSDNRPRNLRFLCPNCDSQLETRGGKNKGRIEKSEGGFAIVDKEKRRHYILPVEPGHLVVTGQPVTLTVKKVNK